jgi:hypothetical protein
MKTRYPVINRRTTLLALAAACGTGLSHAALGRIVDAARTAATGNPPAPAGEADLRADLARVGKHEYSEEGIPMFLACVDEVAEQAGKPAAAPNALSAQLASDLRRYGDAWLRLHPDAPDTDVAKLIEMLAQRDFAHGTPGGAS